MQKFRTPYFLLPLIGMLASCSPVIVDVFDTKVPLGANAFIASPNPADSPNTTIGIADCTNAAQVLVTENLTTPAADDLNWKPCVAGGTISYTTSSSTVGYRTLNVWTKSSTNILSPGATSLRLLFAPKLLFGQPDYASNINLLKGMGRTTSILQIGTKLAVSDWSNSRVLIYNNIPTSNQAVPDVILGQLDLGYYSNSLGGTNASSLYNPWSLATDGTKLLVADSSHNRVLIWNTVPTTNFAPAALVLGQPDMYSSAPNYGGVSASSLSYPAGIHVAGGKLFVTDYRNNRILIWNTFPTSNNQAADVVVGQPDFTSNISRNGGTTAKSLAGPYGVGSDGTKMFVADYSNHRVLIWNTIPSANFTAADVVLGQPGFTTNTSNNGGISATSLNSPLSAQSDGTRLIIADYNNARLLIWNTIPTTSNTAANLVLGQPNFTSGLNNSGGLPSSQTLSYPVSLSTNGGSLFIADGGNNRALIWSTFPTSNTQAADFVIGQPGMTQNNTASAGANANLLGRPYGISSDGNRLIVSDYNNNRMLLWNSLPLQTFSSADKVLGQSDLTSSIANQGGTTPAANTLNAPSGNILVNGKLIVADTGNNRVLIWNTLPTNNNTPADIALGQPNTNSATANTGGISSSTLNGPSTVASDGTRLAVTDQSNHRILIWNTIPSASSTAADVILGQPDGVSSVANNGGLSAHSLSTPSGVAFSGSKLLVADQGNYRILIWNTIPSSNNVSADVVIGQPDMVTNLRFNGTPLQRLSVTNLFVANGRLFVAGANQVSIWDQIPTSSFQPANRTYGYPRNWSANSANGPMNEYTINPSALYADTYRLFIADRSPSRILVIPIPDISLSSSYVTNSPTVSAIIADCTDHPSVLINAGASPLATDPNWHACSVGTPYSYSLSGPTDGYQYVSVWTKDAFGNVLPIPTILPFIYDSALPRTPSSTLASNYFTNSTAATLTLTNCGDAVKVMVTEINSPPSAASNSWQTCTTATGGITYTLTDTTNGVHTLYIWAMDIAGNITSTAGTTPLNYDTTPPAPPAAVIANQFVGPTTGTTLTITDCTDRPFIFVNEGTQPLSGAAGWIACSTTAGAITYLVTGNSTGSHALKVWAKDAAGNVSSSATTVNLNYVSNVVLGQNSFTNQENAATGMWYPGGSANNGTALVIADTYNNRVLLWNTAPTTNGQAPDIVLGQMDFISTSANQGSTPTASTLYMPRGLAISGGKLFVADTSNSRVLIWNTLPTSNGQAADVVLGQPNFTSNTLNNGGISTSSIYGPFGVSVVGSQLFVSDFSNHRVQIWNTIPTANNTPADVILGQPSATVNASNNGGLSASSMNHPVHSWSDGSKLYVADSYNHRILGWNTIPSTTGQPADFVLGQSNFTSGSANAGGAVGASTLNYPYNIGSDGTRLYVADDYNHRVLIWNTLPSANAQAANLVLGQAVMTTNTAVTSAVGLNYPTSLTILGSTLWVTDYGNHRAIKWNTLPLANATAANVVVGQELMSTGTPNYRTASSFSAQSLTQPSMAIAVGTKLIATDTANNRVLIWNSIPSSNNAAADVELGQPNMTSSAYNNGGASAKTFYTPTHLASDGTKLIVTDKSNHRVLIWNTIPSTNQTAADVILGQTVATGISSNQGGAVSASTLYRPYGVATDGTHLVISDSSNQRVLIWNSIPTSNATPADVVLGQADMTHSSINQGGAISAQTLYSPAGISINGGKLAVGDSSNNRVLIWNTFPTANNQAADVVLGQADMTTGGANAPSSSANIKGLYTPLSVLMDSGHLYVTDTNNQRIAIWNTIPTVNFTPADTLIGQASATSAAYNGSRYWLSPWSYYTPNGISIIGGQLWIADTGNHRILSLTPP